MAYIDQDWLYDQMNAQGSEFDLVDALEMIENFPAADVAPVVRCRDCRWSKKVDDREPMYACNNICRYGCTQWLDSNDFCSYGERRI